MRHDKVHLVPEQSQPGCPSAKAVAFPKNVHQVDILKIGRSRVIVPQGNW
jgi:hypothetical protein